MVIYQFWLFSIVCKPADAEHDTLTVRSRTREDLEMLRARYLPDLSDILENAGTDYRFRAHAPRQSVGDAMRQALLDLDYANFKGEVVKVQGQDRAAVYHEVWDIVCALQPEGGHSELPSARAVSYGGVVFDGKGNVLLRQPVGQFDGYVWTFAKGKARRGETAVAAAQREVHEETGVPVRIVGKIPGRFRGGTGWAEYFIMEPDGPTGLFDPAETAAVRWVSVRDAPALLRETRNAVGRDRDLAVLNAAVDADRQRWD